MTTIHVVRSIIGIVALVIASVAFARSLEVTKNDRVARIALASVYYSIFAGQLTNFNGNIIPGTVFLCVAEAVGLVYLYVTIRLWRDQHFRRKAEHEHTP